MPLSLWSSSVYSSHTAPTSLRFATICLLHKMHQFGLVQLTLILVFKISRQREMSPIISLTKLTPTITCWYARFHHLTRRSGRPRWDSVLLFFSTCNWFKCIFIRRWHFWRCYRSHIYMLVTSQISASRGHFFDHSHIIETLTLMLTSYSFGKSSR